MVKHTQTIRRKLPTNYLSVFLTIDNTDTRTMPGVSIVNFEHTTHFILLLFSLNSNKQMSVGPEKL